MLTTPEALYSLSRMTGLTAQLLPITSCQGLWALVALVVVLIVANAWRRRVRRDKETGGQHAAAMLAHRQKQYETDRKAN